MYPDMGAGSYHFIMARSRRGRRPPAGRARKATVQQTSVPTGRAAYAETRAWLLKVHGPVCAYCGLKSPTRTLTLDHVTPRRGQSAYDRRDNLVLACKRCNAAKADKPFLAWVLGGSARAENLYRYGQHLSEGILELLRPMVGAEVVREVAEEAARAAQSPPKRGHKPAAARKPPAPRLVFGPDDDDSPYAEPSPYLDAPAPPPLRVGKSSQPRSPTKRPRRRSGRRRSG